MREILFRGKRIDNGEWVYGFYFCMYHDDDRKHLHHFIIPLNVPISKDKPIGEIQVEVDPEIVGQYTGLTANGKKIFEGDIVSGFFNHEKIVGYIFYGSDASFFIQRDGLFGIGLNNASDWLEVIGNIHDNPELLEDEP